VGVRTGAIVKSSGILYVDGAISKNSIFTFLGYPSTVLRTAYRKQFYPNQWYQWKAETLKVCLLLVWRVYDQAFRRYRPMKGAKMVI